MRKIYALVTIVAASFAANAQTNLIPNHSFEDWTAGVPDDWTVSIPTAGGTVEEETTDFQEGAKSAKITAPAGTGNVQLKLSDFAVEEGEEYTFSYWYKDESTDARFRHWGIWRDNTNNAEVGPSTDLKPNGYMPDTSGWEEVAMVVTAPAGATHFRLDFRTYKETGDSGIIYLDNISFKKGNHLSTKQNNIDGLNIFPNPVDEVLNITSDSTADKNVQLFDLTGKKVLDVTTVSQVNVSTLKAGVYVAKITEAGKTATRKIVVK